MEKLTTLMCLMVICATGAAMDAPEFVYHNYTLLTQYLKEVNQSYPNITCLYSIGKSVQGRELWVIAIGETPCAHVNLRPEVKYVGNMHGDESVGREILIHFIYHLVSGYGANTEVTSLLNATRVHILVSMNPDGFENATRLQQEGHCEHDIGRTNANGFDLNRNFPDYFEENKKEIQPETRAIMDWLKQHQFVLSANLHGGALVVNYPYDNYKGASKSFEAKYSPTEDNDVFRHLAMTYALAHPTMYQGYMCARGKILPNIHHYVGGTTNGAEWYPILGSMQDYNYIVGGCMEITLELSCCKYPLTSTLEGHWNDNRMALLKLLQQVHIGVKGYFVDTNHNTISGAYLTFNKHRVTSTAQGEYWKLLVPSTSEYQIRMAMIGSPNHKEETVMIKVPLTTEYKLVEYNLTLTSANESVQLNTRSDARELLTSLDTLLVLSLAVLQLFV
ncbi:Carboxypeptidase M [Lamellibrachia satsuma]|nr:Carboxypeptidase M [Lamellibrachia satsuma]